MLYLVATPIGNLSDITMRALDVLKSVDFILCEDTRHSMVLLNHYGIKATLYSYEKFSETKKTEWVLDNLRDGKNIALITDAGTPCVSDPGQILVKAAAEKGYEYTLVGSSCAAISALVLSGFDSRHFTFVGFLPEKNSARKELVESFKEVKSTLIFYVSPHSYSDDLELITGILGRRKACLVREISKTFEEKIFFNLGDDLSGHTIKGELVLVTEGNSAECSLSSLTVEEHVKHYISAGCDEKEAMKLAAKDRGVSKSEIYAVIKKK